MPKTTCGNLPLQWQYSGAGQRACGRALCARHANDVISNGRILDYAAESHSRQPRVPGRSNRRWGMVRRCSVLSRYDVHLLYWRWRWCEPLKLDLLPWLRVLAVVVAIAVAVAVAVVAVCVLWLSGTRRKTWCRI